MLGDPLSEAVEILIPHNYSPRYYQVPFWDAMKTKKRAVICWHRRSGKDKTCWNFLIKEAFKRVGVYYYLFPTYSQGRKVMWDGIDGSGFKFINHIPGNLVKGLPNSTEMKIRLINGSLIQVIGVDNIDRIVGTNPIGCIFSEYSLQDPRGWEFIRPILRENGGWAVFQFTPRGHNHAKDMYDMALHNDNWFCQKLTVKDTGIISTDDIEKEKDDGMSEDMVQQEFYCDFSLGIEGSYYAKYIQQAREDDRIGHVPWDTGRKVFTATDFGYNDSTAIVWYQLGPGKEIHVIDHYENNGHALSHYIDILDRKGYTYGGHFAPHDVDSHTLSSGLSIKEVARDAGIAYTTLPTLKLGLQEGIEAVRGLFPRIYIDATKCGRLIKCLENYQKRFDEKYNVYGEKPIHSWASHSADAFRYMCLAIKLHTDTKTEGISDKQAQIWYEQNNPRFN